MSKKLQGCVHDRVNIDKNYVNFSKPPSVSVKPGTGLEHSRTSLEHSWNTSWNIVEYESKKNRVTGMACFLIHHSSHVINRCWQCFDFLEYDSYWQHYDNQGWVYWRANRAEMFHIHISVYMNLAILLEMTKLKVDNSPLQDSRLLFKKICLRVRYHVTCMAIAM